MKRESVRLVLGVILAVLLLPISPALAGDASAENDIELAKEIAQVEVA
jgi:hypothetical protein